MQHPLEKAALITLQTLADMGVCRKYGDGTIDTPRISGLYMSENDAWGLIEFDSTYIPPGVSLHKISDKRIIEEIKARIGRPAGVLNTTGITIAVKMLTPNHLPTHVELDLGSIPTNIQYPVPIGAGRYGPVWKSLNKTSHILVGGESQGGKTTWLYSAIASLIARHSPEELHMVIIDGKSIEFGFLSGIPHLHGWDVATDTEQHIDTIQRLEEELRSRQAKFKAALARNLVSYNNRAESLGYKKLPRIVVVIDEVTDIDLQAGQAFREPLLSLTSLGASLGFTLILSTQNPRFDVMDRNVKGNLSVRIAFRVADTAHSMVILGMPGAEKLPRTVRGRLMARIDSDKVELQGFYLSEEKIVALADLLRGHPLDIKARIKGARPTRLTRLEKAFVDYSIKELGGRFPIREMHEQFKSDISRNSLLRLSQAWESKGWLTPATSGGDKCRHITDELAEILDIENSS